MLRRQGNGMVELRSVGFQPGVTDVLTVPDTAGHAITYREGEEVARTRLNLVVTELNRVKL